MKYIMKCKVCDGRELKLGDIVTPTDGSAMPNALQKLTWNGSCGSGFKPVRVLAISGEMLGVVPASWDDKDTRIAEMFREDVNPAIASLWVGNERYGEGFWINAHTSHLKELS